MKFEDITEMVLDECKRIQRNKKLESEVGEAFETAPDFDEIPADVQKKIDEHNFFFDGPEVTVPADEFVFEL